jgi:hypothetical protein
MKTSPLRTYFGYGTVLGCVVFWFIVVSVIDYVVYCLYLLVFSSYELKMWSDIVMNRIIMITAIIVVIIITTTIFIKVKHPYFLLVADDITISLY